MSVTPKEYLEKKVEHILDPLIGSILLEDPEDVVFHMIQWLERLDGNSTGSSISAEKQELLKLRREMQGYAAKHEDKELEVESNESEYDDEEQDEINDLIEKKMNAKKTNPRSSVSAEVYGMFNKKEAFTARVIEKSPEARDRIEKTISSSILFNNLEPEEFKTVVDAMEEHKFAKGDSVIKQGDNGDILFLIEKGELDCSRYMNEEIGEKYLKTYVPGESFGELALLYNAPRAATIVAKTDSILWALDRATFNNIVKDAAMKKREAYESFLKTVEILSTIDHYELGQICDALKTERFKSGDVVIKQGDDGDKFYIIQEGKAEAFKETDGKEEKVLEYKPADYFGELALMKNAPRAATVKATVDF